MLRAAPAQRDLSATLRATHAVPPFATIDGTDGEHRRGASGTNRPAHGNPGPIPAMEPIACHQSDAARGQT